MIRLLIDWKAAGMGALAGAGLAVLLTAGSTFGTSRAHAADATILATASPPVAAHPTPPLLRSDTLQALAITAFAAGIATVPVWILSAAYQPGPRFRPSR